MARLIALGRDQHQEIREAIKGYRFHRHWSLQPQLVHDGAQRPGLKHVQHSVRISAHWTPRESAERFLLTLPRWLGVQLTGSLLQCRISDQMRQQALWLSPNIPFVRINASHLLSSVVTGRS